MLAICSAVSTVWQAGGLKQSYHTSYLWYGMLWLLRKYSLCCVGSNFDKMLFSNRALVVAVLVTLAERWGVFASNRTDFVVSAYLPEWRYSGVDWSLVSQGVSHLILFSVEILPSGSIGALDRIPSPPNLKEALSAAASNGCRVMLCVGGNGRSDGFPAMVARKELRVRFLKELLALLDKLELHGVDYNWCGCLARRTFHSLCIPNVSCCLGSTPVMIFAPAMLQMMLLKWIMTVWGCC